MESDNNSERTSISANEPNDNAGGPTEEGDDKLKAHGNIASDENVAGTVAVDTADTTEESVALAADFKPRITKQTVNSVTIDWNLIEHTEVYKIEKYHSKRDWEKVAWTSSSPATIEQLEENFGYRFRIKALQLSESKQCYDTTKVSEDIIVMTEAALPTTVCLQRAIKKGQQFLVKRILRRRPSLIEYPGPNGYLPLANAIIHSDMCLIDLLLTEGASVHVGHPRTGRTPLHLAFYHGRMSAARILLNKRAKLEATDCNGMTAAHFAIDANQGELLKFALDSGTNLEAKDACGWTLLLRGVVMAANVNLLKMLVAHGADLSVSDNLRQNCVQLARMYRRQDALEYFEKVLKYRQRLEAEALAAKNAAAAAAEAAEAAKAKLLAQVESIEAESEVVKNNEQSNTC